MLYNKSMKKYLSIIIISLFVTANFFALTKLKFANGTTLAFEACSDGSIRFEAKGKKSYAPVKEFELKRKPAATDFKKTLTELTNGTITALNLLKTAMSFSMTAKNCTVPFFLKTKNF